MVSANRAIDWASYFNDYRFFDAIIICDHAPLNGIASVPRSAFVNMCFFYVKFYWNWFLLGHTPMYFPCWHSNSSHEDTPWNNMTRWSKFTERCLCLQCKLSCLIETSIRLNKWLNIDHCHIYQPMISSWTMTVEKMGCCSILAIRYIEIVKMRYCFIRYQFCEIAVD